MEAWNYAVLGMLGIIGYVVVLIYERLKSVETKIDRLTFQYEKDNLPEKLNSIIDSSITIENQLNKLDQGK